MNLAELTLIVLIIRMAGTMSLPALQSHPTIAIKLCTTCFGWPATPGFARRGSLSSSQFEEALAKLKNCSAEHRQDNAAQNTTCTNVHWCFYMHLLAFVSDLNMQCNLHPGLPDLQRRIAECFGWGFATAPRRKRCYRRDRFIECENCLAYAMHYNFMRR